MLRKNLSYTLILLLCMTKKILIIDMVYNKKKILMEHIQFMSATACFF